MHAVWLIAKNDLALRIRDRSVFIIGIIAPLALAFIFNLIFGGGISDVGDTITLHVGVANVDGGPVGEAFEEVMDSLVADGFIELTVLDGRAAAQAAADDGSIGAAIVLPIGMSDAVIAGQDANIEVIGNVDAPTTTQIAASIAEQFALGARTANLSVATALATGVVAPQDAFALAAEASAAPPIVTIGTVKAATRQLEASAFFVAGLSVFFMFFIAGMSITSMLEERREGTLSRLLAAPIARWSVIAGKSLASVIIGIVSLTVLVIVSSLIMGAEWGNPFGVGLLVLGAVLAVVAIMTLVGAFAKTPEQAANLQAIVAVTLSMLSGTFVPFAPGGLLSRISLLAPNSWFLRGLGDLAGGVAADALPAFGVLMAFAVAFGSVGLVVAGKAMQP